MIPLSSSPTALQTSHDPTTMSPCSDDVTKMEPCTPLARHVVAVEAGVFAIVRSAMPNNACTIARKRVRFADCCLDNGNECDNAMTTKVTSRSSPAVKRRRRCSVWPEARETRDQQEHLIQSDDPSTSFRLESIDCNLDQAIHSRKMTSLSDDDERSWKPAAVTLPTDPRVWTLSDVHTWLRQTMNSASVSSQQHQQPIDVDLERFHMNGKALCLMTSAMFAYRVPQGGHLLYKDFQARLCRAIAVSLHRKCTVGEP